MTFEDLFTFTLKMGSHDKPEDGLCAMEAVAWLEGLPHSDRPECTCPVLAAYTRSLNDRMPEDERQKLVAVLPHLIVTGKPFSG